MPGPQLVDVHAHFLVEEYVRQARAAGVDHPDHMPGWPSWSAEQHLALMDETGVDRSLLSLSSPSVHFGDDVAAEDLARLVNDVGRATVRAHPGRFGQLATLSLPDVEAAVREIDRAYRDLHVDGVGVYTSYAGSYLDEPQYAPVLERLDRHAALVLVHPTAPYGSDRLAAGMPLPMLEFLVDTARMVTRLRWHGTLDRYPRIRWVVPHGGGLLPLLDDRVALVRGYVDPDRVLSGYDRLWFDLAGGPFPHQVPALLGITTEDRLLYGSDYCWTRPEGVRAQVASIDAAPPPATATSWRALCASNAAALLGPEEARRAEQ